ncbi:MAG: zf-HC2 domain-containing protein [Pirellulaceae bacterium]|nr:zf-HC2 domain-containing protein [Pirellulaceae bacterium]
MSDCEGVRSQLSALIDGELSSTESRVVENHLQACTACRQELELLTDIDNRLTRALDVSSLERKCAEILQAAKTMPPMERVNSGWHAWRLVSVGLLVVAATVLLALFPVFWEKDSTHPPAPSLNLVAQLTRATGPVQFLQPGETNWTEVAPNARKSLAAGSRLKTANGVLCEIATTSQGVLRMNESAEVVFVDADRVELIAGKLWCLTPNSSNIEVVIPEANQQAPAPLVFACPSSTELQCMTGDWTVTCDSISRNNSTATMTLGSVSCSVEPGETVSINREQKIDRKLSVDASSKIWQLPLLAIGAEVDEELVALLDRILAPIGMSKARSLNEDQLRSLGPVGAIPLLAYASVESPTKSLANPAADHLHLRRTAVRLASEMVDERGIRLLKELTADPDEYISSVAKGTLNRLNPQPH